jgi:primosomal protein DnaI
VYVPEFLREIKQSIQDQTLNEKIDFVKKAQVLMLDDFGAEAMSAWTRDEVLGTILQYRMAEQLPTFFTSNLSYDELENHLTYTQRGDKDVVKASRIMERIRMVSTDIKLSGENRRK